MDSGKKIGMAGAALVALSAVVPRSGIAATAPLHINVQIVNSNLLISASKSLNFGSFVNTGAGSILVQPVGATNYNGQTPVGVVQKAQVKLTGSAGRTVGISVTNPTVVLSNTAATKTMVVSQFQINTDAGGAINNAITMPGTTRVVPIGATLNVGAGQAVGTYNGTVNVQAIYQ